MHLPDRTFCQSDPFLYSCWLADQKGFFRALPHANTRFLDRRRTLTARQLLKRHLSSDRSLKVADFACGTANFGILLAEDGYSVDFVDNEPRFFDYISKKTSASGLRFIAGDVNSIPQNHTGYAALFFGEAIEHMAQPAETLRALHARLAPGGLLCLTTPNGDYVDCNEPAWREVADQPERNARIANTIGNHVCEFRMHELKELLQEAGFGLLNHELVCSKQISKRYLLRFLPERWLWPLDRRWSKQKSGDKSFGRVQIVVARKFH